jgi:predicted RNA binding protein YcfA (HicA-like mRNA interferase family)
VNPHQPVVSGRRLVKVLEAEGWEVARQRGSHVRLRKDGRRLALVVPLHRELKKGTVAGILRDAGLHPDDLRRLLER